MTIYLWAPHFKPEFGSKTFFKVQPQITRTRLVKPGPTYNSGTALFLSNILTWKVAKLRG